jgi:hypothetical protein
MTHVLICLLFLPNAVVESDGVGADNLRTSHAGTRLAEGRIALAAAEVECAEVQGDSPVPAPRSPETDSCTASTPSRTGVESEADPGRLAPVPRVALEPEEDLSSFCPLVSPRRERESPMRGHASSPEASVGSSVQQSLSSSRFSTSAIMTEYTPPAQNQQA